MTRLRTRRALTVLSRLDRGVGATSGAADPSNDLRGRRASLESRPPLAPDDLAEACLAGSCGAAIAGCGPAFREIRAHCPP